ncbi:MAG: flippase [Desulfitobacteriaceae bacterium]|nr:flippase [Desulfitobacteriaceae bacterium]MDD4345915.1 flippase [Desulfitobacteriaceae bacterium]MDD4401023.1 flippase [Desulfitobacteriaceae bacterium]
MGFTKSVTITFFSNTFLFFLSIISTTILARLLGPEGKGVYDVASNLLTFATLFLGFGLASSNIYFLGKNREHLEEIIGNNILLTCLGIIPLIPFYFLNAHYQFQFLRSVTNIQILIVLLTVPFINYKSAMINVMLGLQNVVEYNRLNIIDKVLNVILLVIFIFTLVSPSSALLATLVGTILLIIWIDYILLIRVKKLPRLNFSLMRKMLGYGFKAQLGNIVQKLNYRLDIFIVSYFLPIGQVGIYGIAVVMAETLWGISGSIATIVFPIISSAQDKKEMHIFTNQVTRISFTLIVCCSLILVLLNRSLITPFIELWFGSGFTTAAVALVLLLPGVSIFSISNILANYLAGVGLVVKNIYSSIVSAIITVAFDIILIPRFGINGAAIASSLSYIAFTLATLIFYIKYTHCRWQDVLLLKRTDLVLIKTALSQRFKKT